MKASIVELEEAIKQRDNEVSSDNTFKTLILLSVHVMCTVYVSTLYYI